LTQPETNKVNHFQGALAKSIPYFPEILM